MTSTSQRPGIGWMSIVGLLARLILGVTMLVAGIEKGSNIPETQQATRAFQILNYELSNAWGLFMPFLEIGIGVLLILGFVTRLAAVAGSVLMCVFIGGLISVWVRGLRIDCGCFGGGGATAHPTYGLDLVRDSALLLCGLWLVWRPRTRLSLDGRFWG